MSVCLVQRPTSSAARACAHTCDAVRRFTSSTSKHPTSSPPSFTIKLPGHLRLPFTSHSQWAVQQRSLLRGILRESTYLPDPNARNFVSQYALLRFKRWAFKTSQHNNDPAFNRRVWTLAENGRKQLRRLQRANEGDRVVLTKVLQLTYGRTGPRNFALMKPLMPTEGGEELQELIKSSSELEETDDLEADASAEGISETNIDDSKTDDHAEALVVQHAKLHRLEKPLPKLSPALHALAKSQKEANPPNLAARNPKRLEPLIPERNARLLPMPKKRVKNMTKKWYADILSRLLPPLPPSEWEQLRSWALGLDMPAIHIPRRTRIGPAPKKVHFGTSSALEALVIQGRIDPRIYGRAKRHNITQRFMKRLWAQVFMQCCAMNFDDESKKWLVTWGHHELHAHRSRTQEPDRIVPHRKRIPSALDGDASPSPPADVPEITKTA